MADENSSPNCPDDEPVASEGSSSLPDSSGAVTGRGGKSGDKWSMASTKQYTDVSTDRIKKDLSRIDDYSKAFVELSPNAVSDMKGVRQNMRYISPEPLLPILAKHWGLDPYSEEMAKKLDTVDKLNKFRKYFAYPKKKNCIRVDKTNLKPDEECVYFCSNLVGLKPKTVDGYVNEMLQAWANWGVWLVFEGRFAGMTVDQKPTKSLEKIIGARTGEVTLMNGCTVNLHFLLIHFYQPTETRYKIICEENPFSSDTYCFKSQLRMHGIDPEKGLVMVKAREGEAYLRHEDILDAIARHGQQTAVVCFGGVHFLTGQKFDMEDITRAAHEQGCICGFDLAHAVGNVEMHLHRWNVDFAVWTNYKYMAGGQGAIGGAFIHKMHWDRSAPRLEGWWGSKVEKRFLPGPEVDPSLGAGAFRISMCSMWNTVPLFASTEIYDKTCMRSMERKRFWFNGFFDAMLEKLNTDLRDTFGDKSGLLAIPDPKVFNIVTPRDPDERGNQTTLSMKFPRPDVIYSDLTKNGFIMDYKRPNVFRISPHMLYNTFHELFLLVDFLRKRTFEHLNKMAPAYREGMESG